MTFKTSFITAIVGAALVVVPAAWGQSQQLAGSTDAFERAVLASELSSRQAVQVYRDAFERTVSAKQHELSSVGGYADSHVRLSASGSQIRPAASTYPDAFERAVVAGSPTGGLVPGDHHSRVDLPGATPPYVLSISTTREIEWPQVGIGFGIGILLAFGLLMATRLTRIRPLAH